MNTYDEYKRHGGIYRLVDDLSRPWVPSPVSSAVALPIEAYPLDYDPCWTPPKAPPMKVTIPNNLHLLRPRRPALVRWFRKLLRIDKPYIMYELPRYHPLELNPPMPRYAPIPLSEWKAYGYYACPGVNGGHVYNRSPKISSSSSVTVEELFDLLKSPGGTHYPERWVRGLRHPALPPPPERWKRPNRHAPQPFPWECYLNPWLMHDLEGGPSLVNWDIGRPPDTMLMNLEESMALVPLSQPDRCQPATYPFISHMLINAVHVNGYPLPCWKIMVVNEEGISCNDVWTTIHEDFRKPVLQQEYLSWQGAVQTEARTVNEWRQRLERTDQDVLRRQDFLGWNFMFDGLAVNPNRQGWILHLVETRFIPRNHV